MSLTFWFLVKDDLLSYAKQDLAPTIYMTASELNLASKFEHGIPFWDSKRNYNIRFHEKEFFALKQSINLSYRRLVMRTEFPSQNAFSSAQN